MSLTLLTWLALYVLFSVLAFTKRPSWGIALYLMTFYASPHFWWWGRPIVGIAERINLATALLFALAVFVQPKSRTARFTRSQRTIIALLVAYALNATLVHFAFAANPDRSLSGMVMIWKQVGLLFLIMLSIRDRRDLNILVGAIVVGSFYIAFEIIVNGRGHFSGGRLEGVGTAGATEANYLAGLMLLALPLAGYWLFFGSRKLQFFSVIALVFTFEVVLRCNSRGAFLAVLAAGGWLLCSARGKARKYAFFGLLLAGFAAIFMVRDEEIIERFSTTFVSTEERDHSANQRINFWGAAIRMITDHPLGSGAEAAFKSDLGAGYIAEFFSGHKAVHEGYLDIAASWGIQGFTLYLLAVFLAWRAAWKYGRSVQAAGNYNLAFFAASIQAALIGQLGSSVFISSLDGEWFFWCFALSTALARTSAQPALLPQPAFESLTIARANALDFGVR